MPIWNRRCETMDREGLEQLQLERLQATVNRAYRNVRFYHQRLEEAGVEPEDVVALGDIERLPFTTRHDLTAAYPYQMLSVPLRQIVRIHTPAGADESAVVGYTRNDLRTWSELVARVISAAGVTRHDVVQVTFGNGPLAGAFGMCQGAERVGASVVPVSAENVERQIKVLRDFRSTVLVCTAGHAIHLARAMKRLGLDPSETSLRLGLFGGEPFSEDTRRTVENELGISATDNYGLGEVLGPGVSGECEHKSGLHVNEDHFLVEVVDPGSLQPVPAGQQGELVITTLSREGMPLLRYRTGALTSIDPNRCSCGRTTVRMSKVAARSDDMVTVRGVNVFPHDIEGLLLEVEGVEPHYQVIIDRNDGLDEMIVMVEVSKAIFSDRLGGLVELEERIRERFQYVLGLTPHLKLVEPMGLDRSPRGQNRIIDRRRL